MWVLHESDVVGGRLEKPARERRRPRPGDRLEKPGVTRATSFDDDESETAHRVAFA
jgi:hypothetical protein